MTVIGTILVLGMIGGLWFLVREKNAHASRALWIPTFWFLIVFSRPVTMWLQVQRDITLQNQYVESSPVDAAVFGILILGGVLVLNSRARQFRNVLQLNFPILLFFFYCAVSIAWADDPALAFKRWIKAAGEVIVILVMLTDPNPAAAFRRVFTRVSFVLIPLSLLFIFVIPSLGTSYDPEAHKTYFNGVCTWKNQLGLLCMLSGLSSLWQLITAYGNRELKHRVRYLVAYAFMFAVSAGLIVKADAMTSLSCLGLASAMMLVASQKWAPRRPAGVFLLVASTVGLALFAVFIDTAGTLLHSIGRNSTLTGRTRIWAAVLSQHTNPLVGTGFESFWMGARMQAVWDQSQVGINEAHNGYLELYLNMGLIGLVLLGLLIVSGYRHAAGSFLRDPQLGRLRLALFTASLIYSFTEAGFRPISPAWIGFLLAITAAPLHPGLDAKSRIYLAWRPDPTRKPARILQ